MVFFFLGCGLFCFPYFCFSLAGGCGTVSNNFCLVVFSGMNHPLFFLGSPNLFFLALFWYPLLVTSSDNDTLCPVFSLPLNVTPLISKPPIFPTPGLSAILAPNQVTWSVPRKKKKTSANLPIPVSFSFLTVFFFPVSVVLGNSQPV